MRGNTPAIQRGASREGSLDSQTQSLFHSGSAQRLAKAIGEDKPGGIRRQTGQVYFQFTGRGFPPWLELMLSTFSGHPKEMGVVESVAAKMASSSGRDRWPSKGRSKRFIGMAKTL
jgi:hypothetical protein